MLGVILIAAGAASCSTPSARFVSRASAPRLPWQPPQRLVVGGVYRHVRNPMYVAVLAMILGQALLLGRSVLLAYAVVLWVIFASFVRFYEEPTLSERFGADYEAYRSHVPAWLPRLRPWQHA